MLSNSDTRLAEAAAKLDNLIATIEQHQFNLYLADFDENDEVGKNVLFDNGELIAASKVKIVEKITSSFGRIH